MLHTISDFIGIELIDTFLLTPTKQEYCINYTKK